MSIYTNILTGGSNNHETTSENANQVQTDFIDEGVVGAITNTSGVAPSTGALAVNAQGTPDMTVAVSAGVAYVTATPSGQASQTLRVYNNASANVTVAANSSGSTKYDWVYLSVSAANAANPNSAGDNVTTLTTSRSSSASTDDGTPPTYGYPIAVVTVANGATSITNGNISDVRDRVGVTTLGYKEITASVGPLATSTSDQDISGVSVMVRVPSGGRRIKITAMGGDYEQTGGIGTVYGVLKIKEGSTVLNTTNIDPPTANLPNGWQVIASFVPTAGTHTYKLAVANNSTGPNFTIGASSTNPTFILVELD